jgi:hypothetical protein
VDFSLYRTIAAQAGVFTTAQARNTYSEWEIRRLISSGRWRRSRWRGVLLDAEVPDSPALDLRAAALAAGPDLVVCHSTAARLWGFDVLGNATLHFVGPPTLVNRRLPGIQVHPSSLGCDDAVRIDGVWCTPAARTACDVVRLSAPIDGLAVLDAALRSAWCTRDDLAEAAEAQSGLREVVRLRGLIRHADRRAESPMESRMRWRFIDGGLPAPDLQVRVMDGETSRYLDTGWARPTRGGGVRRLGGAHDRETAAGGPPSAQLAHGQALEAPALHRCGRLPATGGHDRNDGGGAGTLGAALPAIMKLRWRNADAGRRVAPPTS